MTQVLLLTFDRLPNRQLTGDEAALTQAYESLDAVSASFENHYLQQPGVDGVLSSPVWPQLMRGLQKEGLNIQWLQDQDSVLPLNETIAAFTTVSSTQTIEAIAEPRKTPGLRWVHVALPAEDESAAERFTQLTQAMIAGDWSTALITPLMGNEAPDSVRFQSLCFESLIKVPLWITDTDRECSRIQAITGSFDIAATLADRFGQRATNEVGSAVSRVIDGDGGSRHDVDSPTEGDTRRLHGPASLLTAVTTPGQPSERSLLIESSTARAIRSRSFLFVTEREPSGSSRPRLYAKPDDGWNVNDVSSEYLQQTRDFEQLLENAVQ